MTWVGIAFLAIWAAYVTAYMVSAARAKRLREWRIARIRALAAERDAGPKARFGSKVGP